MITNDLHWLAGLLEGEGSFIKGPPCEPNRPRICLVMTDKDVVDRAADLMRGRVYQRQVPDQHPQWKPAYRVTIRGAEAVRLMRELYPLMGQRRRAQIDVALAAYIERKTGDNTRKLTEDQVRQIRSRSSETVSSLAQEFGVSRPTIRDVRERRLWKSVEDVA